MNNLELEASHRDFGGSLKSEAETLLTKLELLGIMLMTEREAEADELYNEALELARSLVEGEE